MDPSPPERVFAYLGSDKVQSYRAVMAAFLMAKERFRLHLRPEEIAGALSPQPVEPLLTQLVDWGNLVAHQDYAEVQRVEDFYRPRLLYQLSLAGEAAEEAIALFHSRISHPGELQTSALADLRDTLAELQQELSGTVDLGRAYRALDEIFSRFTELVAQARAFLGSLQRSLDLQHDLERFLRYKQYLVDYLERFVRALVVAAGDISARVAAVEALGIAEVLDRAAERDLGDRLAGADAAERERVRARWHERWSGLRTWFVADGNGPAQADLLRARVLSAIPALLQALAAHNERRARRSDRPADLRTLARWFADCGADHAAAHRLWRAAFCLGPARHLGIDRDTLAAREQRPVRADVSWLEAEPVLIAPRLRQGGRLVRQGRKPAVIDRSAEKATILAALAEEAAQLRAARAMLIGGPRRLSDFVRLDRAAFQLLLDCLGAVLASAGPDAVAEGTSADGSLAIRLEPFPGAPWVAIPTSDGDLHGRDCELTISDRLAPTGSA